MQAGADTLRNGDLLSRPQALILLDQTDALDSVLDPESDSELAAAVRAALPQLRDHLVFGPTRAVVEIRDNDMEPVTEVADAVRAMSEVFGVTDGSYTAEMVGMYADGRWSVAIPAVVLGEILVNGFWGESTHSGFSADTPDVEDDEDYS
jgi:hypothetical protein